MNQHYDHIIVGGGFAGLAIAYHLARRGAAVLLLEAERIGYGASGACAGRAQVSESHRGLHMRLTLDGLARLETLEAELGREFEWRRLGNIMLIEQERHWQWWSEQVAYLQQLGASAAMLSPEELRQAEPLLNVERFLGGAWCLEGHLNPFKFMHAYASAARKHGAVIRQHARVVGLVSHKGRLIAVKTAHNRFAADGVIITAGAWTGQVLQTAGVHLPVQFTHAEAVISEPLPRVLHHHIGLADFYETIHNASRAVSIGVAQQQNGSLLVTEAVEMTERIHRANSAWGIPAIARDLLALFRALADVRMVRAWASPSPFLPDEQPAIGWVPGLENCFVATCFHNTITTIPILSELIAETVLGGQPEIDMSPFNPARFQ
jgi:sarcosine oxidase subunit beta